MHNSEGAGVPAILIASKHVWFVQLKLRRQGNEQYNTRQLPEALEHYNNAKCVLENTKGAQPEDQAEVLHNLVTTELNIAAVHIAQQHYGAAVKSCTTALSMDNNNIKALTRRAKAHRGRHDLQVSICLA